MANENAAARHKKLVKQGWVRRFTAEEPRLSEMKELYESMGMKVAIEAGIPEDDEQCRGCFDAEGFENRYKTIYTRSTEKSVRTSDEELFD
jgi:hypothetical protein